MSSMHVAGRTIANVEQNLRTSALAAPIMELAGKIFLNVAPSIVTKS